MRRHGHLCRDLTITVTLPPADCGARHAAIRRSPSTARCTKLSPRSRRSASRSATGPGSPPPEPPAGACRTAMRRYGMGTAGSCRIRPRPPTAGTPATGSGRPTRPSRPGRRADHARDLRLHLASAVTGVVIRCRLPCVSRMIAAMATTRRADMFTADGKPSDGDPRENVPTLGDERATRAVGCAGVACHHNRNRETPWMPIAVSLPAEHSLAT